MFRHRYDYRPLYNRLICIIKFLLMFMLDRVLLWKIFLQEYYLYFRILINSYAYSSAKSHEMQTISYNLWIHANRYYRYFEDPKLYLSWLPKDIFEQIMDHIDLTEEDYTYYNNLRKLDESFKQNKIMSIFSRHILTYQTCYYLTIIKYNNILYNNKFDSAGLVMIALKYDDMRHIINNISDNRRIEWTTGQFHYSDIHFRYKRQYKIYETITNSLKINGVYFTELLDELKNEY